MAKKQVPGQFSQQDVTIDSTEKVYDGYFKMIKYSFRHRLFAGGWSGDVVRELFERGHAVAILPYDPHTDQVVLIEQIRIGAIAADKSPWQLEIVAGVIDKEGESPQQVAIREAEEEAGLTIEQIGSITRFLPSPGGCSENIEVFYGIVDASKAEGIHGVPDENEDILVHVVPRQQAYEWIAEGKIENAATIIALQWLQLNLGIFKQQITTVTQE
ncbi:ADP-ribose diphosphatase [Veronia nyctiphanis]|uniref:ADP-ribose pyrophosphatase n=1 Tax=Veronia nyctiphanis TaxID=1278244 RepID=A0A4Q0YIK6_9GAMM|nr:ADP-ribose diphosphatase [Veronia nyctiphanis]RXJ70537.1 ADP-ribose diphosphatase [Veronia nyctiphanis]